MSRITITLIFSRKLPAKAAGIRQEKKGFFSF